jgi:hypothetical protein
MRDDARRVTPPDENERPKAAGKRPAQARSKTARTATARAGRSQRPAEVPSTGEHGILSSLPSTRPQRPSARRAAAKRAAAPPRRAAEQRAPAARDAQPAAKRATRAPRSTAKRRAAKRPVEDAAPPPESPIPRQGFEAEDEIEQGTPVHPPTGPELATAMIELFGELAQSGLATSGRLLRDALDRLPGL